MHKKAFRFARDPQVGLGQTPGKEKHKKTTSAAADDDDDGDDWLACFEQLASRTGGHNNRCPMLCIIVFGV